MHSKHLQATARKEPWTIFRAINIIPIILLTLVVVVLVWLWGRMQDPHQYPLQHVKISTNGQHIPKTVIKNTVINNIHGGFFSLNIKQLKNSLLNDPWVQDVSIRRIWPNSLYVQIKEQQPFARWGQTGVLNTNGDVFFPDVKTIPQKLPEMDAPLSIKDKVVAFYKQFTPLLQALHITISKITVTQRLAWTVLLSNGISVVLCQDDIVDRFNTFITIYPKLILGKAQDVVSVNLCYPNGLAIRWKSGQAPNS